MADVSWNADHWKRKEITARDQAADDYLRHCRGSLGVYGEQAQIRLVLARARPGPQDRLLDAGCGVGRFALAAAPRCGSVLAVDFSSKSIALLERELRRRRVENVTAQAGDLNTVELPPRAFDVAVAMSVIHHLPSAELRLAALRRIRESLKPGGRFVMLVYRWGGAVQPPRSKEGEHRSGIYYFAFTPREARDLAAEAGFTRIGVCGFLSIPEGLTVRMPAWLAGLEPALARLPGSARRARMLLVSATAPPA